MTNTFRGMLLLVLAGACAPRDALAHVLDEYLQSTLVVIQPGGDIRLQMNLTPGVEIAEKVIAQIDKNHDDSISSVEATEYFAVLNRDLTVRLDGRDAEWAVGGTNVPPPSELRTGHGMLQVEFLAKFGPLSAGPHRLTFENRHFESLGAYLFNAAQPPSASIRIGNQTRNTNQSTGDVEFTYEPPATRIDLAAAIPYAAVLLVAGGALGWRAIRQSRVARVHDRSSY